jgi:hypothetical membrane protein
VGPTVVILATLTSIYLNPWFTLANPWLTELGAPNAAYNFVFNLGLVIGGIVLFVFVLGLLKLVKRVVGRVGILLLAVSALTFIAIGVFPLGTAPHKPLTAAFFALFGAGLFLVGVDFAINRPERKWGLFSLAVALILLVGLPIDWYIIGCALTGGVGGLVALAWIVLLGIRLLFGNSRKQRPE